MNATTIAIPDINGASQTVSTMDALLADGGMVTVGAKADTAVGPSGGSTGTGSLIALIKGLMNVSGGLTDAKATQTDTTSVSHTSILKQISSSIQSLATAVGTSNLAVTAASGAFASGSIASGAVASGAVASGAFASGSIASGAIASGAVASGAIVDGAMVTVGTKTDAKNSATDTTSVSLISIAKQISASIQTLAGSVTSSIVAVSVGSGGIASGAVASGAVASGAIASGAIAAGAVAAGAFVSGSVLSGAFASGSLADGAITTLGSKADAKSTATDTTAITIMQVLKQISASIQLVGGSVTSSVLAVNQQAQAGAGGVALTVRLLSAANSTNGTNVKASAGRIMKITGYNAASSLRYLKLYNKATTPTVGTDTPVRTETLPATARFDISWTDTGYYFSTGIGFGLTGAGADADTTALTAGDITGLNVDYV